MKYGRRAPKGAPALQLSRLLRPGAVIPPAPAAVDYGLLSAIAWLMLGNDRYGDCVAVTWANVRALVTALLTGNLSYPSLDLVIQFYKTQNPGFPGEDNGMDIQTALEHLVKVGGPDGVQAVAFAKVDHTNRAELEAAHAIFGFVWYGVNVQQAQMGQFDQGQVWDYVPGSPLDGGHSVLGVGYDPARTKFITWARETGWTETFRLRQVEEAWVVIWPEHLGTRQFEAGINQVQLAADWQAITGRPWPVVTPTPVPVPVPVPTPTPVPVPTPPPGPSPKPHIDAADQVLAELVRDFLSRKHYSQRIKAVAAGLDAWEIAKGITP